MNSNFVATVIFATLLVIVSEQSCGDLLPYRDYEDPLVAETDGFGASIALKSGKLLVGSPFENLVGAAHLFDCESGQLIVSVSDPQPTTFDSFGASVDLSEDGSIILIGEPGDSTFGAGVGRAHLFDSKTGGLIRSFDLPAEDVSDLLGGSFGSSVSIHGDRVLIGASSAFEERGRVYLFDRNSGELLSTFDDPQPTFSDLSGVRDLFGNSVKLTSQYILIGSPFDATEVNFGGDVHVFDAQSFQYLRRLSSPLNDPGQFGQAIDIWNDFVVIGARLGGNQGGLGNGAVYSFEISSGDLINSFENENASGFGSAVSIQANQVAVGANTTDNFADNDGKAYLYDLFSGEMIQSFTNPNPTDDGNFGVALVMENDAMAIGSGSGLPQLNSGNIDRVHTYTKQYNIGDVNRDGIVDILDIRPFVQPIVTNTYQCEGDINGDNRVDLLDVDGFIDFLVGS